MNEAWTLSPGQGPSSLKLSPQQEVALGPEDVRVAIKANSINARDIMIAIGQSPLPVSDHLIPLSDGAGEVLEVGALVTDFQHGDRVVAAFNPAHIDGPYRPEMEPSAFGGVASGLLATQVNLPAACLERLPDNVSYEQAACLPCAGVVAWNALFETGSVVPGDVVFATGTGAVSLIALGLAKAAGAVFGISSSDEDKLEQARAMGADFTINYRTEPNWHEAVRRETNGRGANVILETIGPPSIAKSVKATAQKGRVAQIGFKGADGPPIEVLDMMVSSVSIDPVMVGSRMMLSRLVNAVSHNQIQIPIAASFSFSDAPAAFAAARSGEGLGKIVVTHS
ncbi:MAG: NAD(P)-dependent alcohol dehydrogenase [Pseudomonadota bacterium]